MLGVVLALAMLGAHPKDHDLTEGHITVQGRDRSWNDGRLKTPANRQGIDDIAFIDAGTWPGGWAYLPKGIIGITPRNLDANEAIWGFFRQLARG